MRILDIATASDLPVRVVHLAAGASGYMAAGPDDEHDVVEFYDARYPGVREGQSAARSCRADEIRGSSGGLVLDTGEPAQIVDAVTMAVVRAWLADAAPLTGIQDEHTLLPGVTGNLMTTDISDVRAGDIIFLGGHLVRRVLRAPARTVQRGPDGGHLFEYPVTRLNFPDAVTGAGTNMFLIPEGTGVLILRPVPGMP